MAVHLSVQEVVFISLYSVVVTVGITGNLLVVAVVRTCSALHTTTNFLLGNLAITDILILVWVLQSELLSWAYDHPSGIIGDYLCKALTGGFLVSFLIRVGVLTLTALAYERYNALVNAMNSGFKLTKENFSKVIITIWITSLLVGIPQAAASRFDEEVGYCVGVWTNGLSSTVHLGYRIYATSVLAIFNIIPALSIAFCYYKIVKGLAWDMTICGQDMAGQNDIRAKKKIVRILATVTVLFYVSYVPFIVSTMLSAWQGDSFASSTLVNMNIVSSFLVFCSSCFNPILYSCQSTNYRQGMKTLLAKVFKCPCRNCSSCVNNKLGLNVSAKYDLRDSSHETSLQRRERYNSRKSTTQEETI